MDEGVGRCFQYSLKLSIWESLKICEKGDETVINFTQYCSWHTLEN